MRHLKYIATGSLLTLLGLVAGTLIILLMFGIMWVLMNFTVIVVCVLIVAALVYVSYLNGKMWYNDENRRENDI